LTRGIDDRTGYVVGEVAASEVKDVQDFVNSQRMHGVFRRVNEMSTLPVDFIWLEEVTP
jgi:hypothetical protein